jgi:hypothetical protein
MLARHILSTQNEAFMGGVSCAKKDEKERGRLKATYPEADVYTFEGAGHLIPLLKLNWTNKHWDRSNHGEHGASRGKAINITIPVFPVLPVVEPVYQCCLVVRPAKADAFSGRQSHQGKSQTPCSLDGRGERNQGPEAHRSTIFRMAASHRAVTKVNAQVAPKNTNSGGRAYG